MSNPAGGFLSASVAGPHFTHNIAQHNEFRDGSKCPLYLPYNESVPKCHHNPMIDSLESLQYPIGRFHWPGASTPGKRKEWIRAIAKTPTALRRAISGLTPNELDVPYREGGWTVRQVVHHYADDHMNSYIRFKLALTEDAPAIKGYSEPQWAELPDARSGPIEPSLKLLEALHQRWVSAWEALEESQWERTFIHPTRGPVSLDQLAGLYAWHGKHHVTQIERLRERNGW